MYIIPWFPSTPCGAECVLYAVFLQYLRSVRPLLDDAEYERMVKLAEEFRTALGPRLQRYLWLKSWYEYNGGSRWARWWS